MGNELPILRAQIKDQNAKSKIAPARRGRVGMEFRDGVHGTPYALEFTIVDLRLIISSRPARPSWFKSWGRHGQRVGHATWLVRLGVHQRLSAFICGSL